MLIFSFCAFLSLEPGLSPTIKLLVFLLIEDVTEPPKPSIDFLAFLRDWFSSLPVITNVCPDSGPLLLI